VIVVVRVVNISVVLGMVPLKDPLRISYRRQLPLEYPDAVEC